jgi:solute carrier family 25 2-oxodicarboxylate transporter 21
LWKPESKASELGRNFVAGFLAGTLATTFNTPFDVVKSRNQNIKTGEIPWSFPALVQLYQKEGFQALFKVFPTKFEYDLIYYQGYVPRILRLGPGGGIMLLAFDLVSSLI